MRRAASEEPELGREGRQDGGVRTGLVETASAWRATFRPKVASKESYTPEN